MTTTTRALVLGGGGVTGIAWEIGLLTGLAREGVDLTTADTVIGTSAGSVVGAQITGSQELEKLYDDQLGPPDQEIGAHFGPATWFQLAWPMVLPGRPTTKRRRSAAIALRQMRSRPGLAEQRVQVVRSRIGVDHWPDRDLRVVTVEAATGRSRIFDPGSGTDLVRVVTASCAVPSVWPAVAIDGHCYVDGGLRSVANADLAKGADRIVVLAPLTQPYPRYHALPAQLARAGAQHTAVVEPDKEARSATGKNPLDPAKRPGAARAGLRQGALVADLVRRTWEG